MLGARGDTEAGAQRNARRIVSSSGKIINLFFSFKEGKQDRNITRNYLEARAIRIDLQIGSHKKGLTQ